MLNRTAKQLIIGAVYIIIFVAVVGGVYWSKNSPTCFDSVKNGKEEGVDCGTLACGKACVAPVQAIHIQSVNMAQTPSGDHDVAIQLYNPNVEFGVSKGVYEFSVGGGQPSTHNFYMLPGQTKYLVLTSLKNISDSAGPDVVIKSVEWEKTAVATDNPFIVTREAFSPGVAQSAYEAVIVNNSNFDFDTADINIVVFNSAGNIIATNMTNLQTILSHTDRSIKVTWPFALPADARIQAEVNTNLFNDSNFLKRNGTLEKFQQYY